MDRWRGQELFYEAVTNRIITQFTATNAQFQISHVDDILKQVHAIALTVMNTTRVLTAADMQNRFELLRQVNQIFEAMLLSVDSYRDQVAQLYVGLGTLTLWTFEPNVREVLSQQIDLTQLFLNESLQSASSLMSPRSDSFIPSVPSRSLISHVTWLKNTEYVHEPRQLRVKY
jgi:hypothetical protein